METVKPSNYFFLFCIVFILWVLLGGCIYDKNGPESNSVESTSNLINDIIDNSNIEKVAKSFYVETQVAVQNGSVVSCGTGFLVEYDNNPYLVTNWHVGTGRETDLRRKNPTPDSIVIFYQLKGRNGFFSMPINGFCYEYRDSSSGVLFDIMVCKIEDKYRSRMPPFKNIDFNTSIDIGKSKNLQIIGYPKSHISNETIFSSPKVIDVQIITLDSIKSAIGNKVVVYNLDKNTLSSLSSFGYFINYPVEMEDGVSGSPVYSDDELIGIYSSKFPLGKFDVGYFWDKEAIQLVLEKGQLIDMSKLK